MTEDLELDAEQKEFLGKACAFLRTNPPREEVDQLLVLAQMLLPPALVEPLREQARLAAASQWDDTKLARWLQ